MGTVWRAEDVLLGRSVAVKTMRMWPGRSDEELATLLERTRREARSAARINHPNVVAVYDVVEDQGLPCVIMEYVPSRTLGELLREDEPLPVAQVSRIGRDLLAALRAAHAAGVLHRDVKPGNVLLGTDGRLVLTDFGIAVASGTTTLTRTGELIGSVDYLAPELVKGGEPSPASDLWALGAVLYEALEGRPPFRRGATFDTAYAITAEPLEPLTRGGDLVPLVEGLLAKDPEARTCAVGAERLLGTPGAKSGAKAAAERATERATAVLPRPAEPAATATVSAPEISAPTARPRRRVRRTLGWTAVAVAVSGATLAGLVLLPGATHRVSGAGPTTAASSAQVSPLAPSVLSGPSPVAKGYHLQAEPDLGLSVPVPDGWTRRSLTEVGETAGWAYVDPGKQISLRVGMVNRPATVPLQFLQEDEALSVTKGNFPGYQRLAIQDTSYREMAAATWDFTFQGHTGEYSAAAMAFGRSGTRYIVYLSAPSADWARNRSVFDNALAGLRLDR
ncbi:hypothetical protein GCM10009738_09940 [Kitasatospora viridis]|uniref:non-specific serine/threonine protein kinase n=2 Tax=Kitasatospora viridis TaxID=281105 RepID=A0A561TSN0_9ACTN|nr:protein kinase-like protein [Kitasatospora viridis]